MLLIWLACTPPVTCPTPTVDHALDSAKSSVQIQCPGADAVQLFGLVGGVEGTRPDARLSFCAHTPAQSLDCDLPLPLTFEARLPVVYAVWESPAMQPEEVQARDWTVQRSDQSWDVHGVEVRGEAKVQYSVHVPAPR